MPDFSKEQIQEAENTILATILKFGKATLDMFKSIPYRKKSMQRLLSQQRIVKQDGNFVLTELGKQEAGMTPAQREEKREQIEQQKKDKKEEKNKKFVQATIAKFHNTIEEHGILSVHDLLKLANYRESLVIQREYKSISIASRSLNEEERTWFFIGKEQEARRKVLRIVKQIVLQRWLTFVPKFITAFGIELDIGENPTTTAIKKAISARAASLNKIGRDTGISMSVLKRAIQYLNIPHLITPERIAIFPLDVFSKNLSEILGYHTITTAHIAAYLGIDRESVRRRIRKFQIRPYSKPSYSSYRYFWKDVRCLFSTNVPDVRDVLSHFATHRQELVEYEERKREEKRKREEEKIQRERERLLLLKDQLLAMFPVKARGSNIPKVVFHIGPANSGKTYDALEALQRAENGIYLAPLRLLAWETFEKLNNNGFSCSLLTGEEVISRENARFFSATVEMMPETFWDVVVLDESQMATDEERGWAWTRVLNSVRTDELHICCGTEAETLLENFLSKLGYHDVESRHYERLCPLQVAQTAWSIENPPDETIFVVFRRIDALALKNFFESKGIPTSVIYGALPPSVRRGQTERFISGETKLCVATDAIGMGMNLPARNVCFTTLEKFDGHEVRPLTPLEIRQIAGRAGRFGLQDFGEVGAISKRMLENVRMAMNAKCDLPSKVRIAPTLLELEIMEGSLANRLMLWLEMNAIPQEYLQLIEPCSLTTPIRLAHQILKPWETQLGIEKCFTIVNAPVAENAEEYWRTCVERMAKGDRLSPPGFSELYYNSGVEALDLLEQYVKEAEVFLWLGNRQNLQGCISLADRDSVLEQKDAVSKEIDSLLKKKIAGDLKTCRECGEILPPLYPYGICEACYISRHSPGNWNDWKEDNDWE